MVDTMLKVLAFMVLMKYVASGVGATAGPLLAPWRARREGKARIITAKDDAEVQRIQAESESSTSQLIAKEQAEARKYAVASDELELDGDRITPGNVQKAVEFQAKKRLMNVRAIAGHAAEELGDTEVPNHDPDPDWTARFFDGAQDVSSEKLQKLWGKILAGEVKSPGQTSLRTLSILRDMTQQEAKDFSDLMRFRIDNFILSEALPKVLGRNSNSWIAHFSDIGLIDRIPQFFPDIMLGNDGKLVIKHCGRALIIQGRPGQGFSKLLSQYDTWGMDYNTCLITTAGLELAKLCQHEQPNRHYLSHLARLLDRYKCKLKLAEIINQNSESFQHSEPEIIQPFVEPEERNQEEPNNAE